MTNGQQVREIAHLLIPVVGILSPIILFLIIKYGAPRVVETLLLPLLYLSFFVCLITLLGGGDLIEEQYNVMWIDNYKSTTEEFDVGTENYYSTTTYTSNDKNAINKKSIISFSIYAIAILSVVSSIKLSRMTDQNRIK